MRELVEHDNLRESLGKLINKRLTPIQQSHFQVEYIACLSRLRDRDLMISSIGNYPYFDV